MAKQRRRALTPRQRKLIYQKAGGRCHVCGGKVSGTKWVADHVFPHSHGGECIENNFLPACEQCNRARWSHPPRVIRWILRLGIYSKMQVIKGSKLGKEIRAGLNRHHRTQLSRRAGSRTKR